MMMHLVSCLFLYFLVRVKKEDSISLYSMKKITVYFDAGCGVCISFMKFVKKRMSGVSFDANPLSKEQMMEIDSWRVKIGNRQYFKGEAFFVLLGQKYWLPRFFSKIKPFVWVANGVYRVVSGNRHSCKVKA